MKDFTEHSPTFEITRGLLWVLALIPPLFLLIAVQYSAITVPYWDHCELVKFFVKYYDGHLTLSDLWSPHNHTRPFTYRAVMILNGILTDWDLRSEYIYLLGSLYAAFAIQAHTLWRIGGRRWDTVFLSALVILSIFFFSPAGHNNHFWSMMCQLTFANLFIAFALTHIAFDPRSWKANLAAAVAIWLATYTLTNGLIALIAVAAVVQLSHPNPWRVNRFTVFWAINLAVLLPMYLPGLPENPENVAKAGLLDMIWFCFIYVGSPVLYILHYSFKPDGGMPKPQWNGVVGVVFVAAVLWVARKYRPILKQREPASLLFIGFALFTFGSAAATSIGRAGFTGGVVNAAASRYTIFSAYLVYGLLFLLVNLAATGRLSIERQSSHAWKTRRWLVALFVVLLLLAAQSYQHSISVYRHVRSINKEFTRIYMAEKTTPDEERVVYPSAERFESMKADLKRLRIGPFRNLPPSPPPAVPPPIL